MTSSQIKKITPFTQRDNKFKPGSTCFPASVCMAISYFSANKFDKNFDSYVIDEIMAKETEHKNWLKEKIGQWTWAYMPFQVFAFWEKFIPEKIPGLKARTLEKNLELYKSILTKRPLVFATSLTHSGHMVCGVSYNAKEDTWGIIDPWGKNPYSTEEEKNFLGVSFIKSDKIIRALDIFEA